MARTQPPVRTARRLPDSILGISLCALAVLAPWLLPDDKWIRVAALALVYVALAAGLNVLVGMAGLLDLGFIAFFVIGAYTTAILTVRLFVDQWGLDATTLWWVVPISVVVAVLLAGLAGSLIGYPTLRARGDYLAIMTLGFGEIIRLVSINWVDFTGGSVGIRGVPPLAIGSTVLTSPTQVYWVVLVVVAIVLAVLAMIIASPVGRAWNALREDEVVAASVGIAIRRYKLLAYVVGASVAGVIGVFFAHMQQFINPDSFTLEDNFIIVALVVIGGAGTFWGPALGAVLWIFFRAWAADLTVVQEHPELRTGLLALIVIVLMILRPKGLVTRRARLMRRPAPADGAPEFVLDRPARPAGEVTLVVDDVGVSFGGVTALRDVSFTTRHGDVVGLMGPNGAGKTTLLNVMSGITPPDHGTVTVCGRGLSSAGAQDAAAVGIGRTFQAVRLFWDMTVLENLLVGAHARLRSSVGGILLRRRSGYRAQQASVDEARFWLGVVGLADAEHRRASSLTYGDQRRVEIARALMTRPHLLLLDEPAAGMNESETRALAALVSDIRDRGVDIIVIEHDIDMLMSICDRIVVLDRGAVIADGTARDIRHDAATIEAYLGSDA